MVGIFEGLECHVAQALDDGDAVEEVVGGGVVAFCDYAFEKTVEGEEADEAEGGAEVGYHGAGHHERGDEGWGGDCGWQFLCCFDDWGATDEAGDVAEDFEAGGRDGVEVREDVEGVVEGGEAGAESGGGLDESGDV